LRTWADENAAEVERLTSLVAEAERSPGRAVSRSAGWELAQGASIQQRLAALQEDLQKNLDAQKLRNMGSKVAEAFSGRSLPNLCSTNCRHPNGPAGRARRLCRSKDNIEYIRSQQGIFLRLKTQVEGAITELERQLTAATAEVNETNARIRALRADLVAPSHTPSIASLEHRLRLEARLQALEDAHQRFEQEKEALKALAG